MSQMCSRGLKCQQGNYKIFSFQACLNFFTKKQGNTHSYYKLKENYKITADSKKEH